MEDVLVSITVISLDFLKSLWGILNTPYQTYRRLSQKGKFIDLLPLFLLIGGYFFLVSPLRAHSFHPFLLTYNFGKLVSGFLFTFVLVVVAFYSVGALFKRQGRFEQIAVSWGFSLVPTLVWFFMTSFFYVFLPPPRQLTILGKAFSIVFFSASLLLFFWKGILYYLTLRFALKLDFLRIMGASMILFPLGMVYAIVMYNWGIFKIPFI